ncbi:MAG TPA: putative O-glycosylation ligase, exosortase A system-associated [Stellaceae bacterium]|jgi:probable O-glycosylation ligase (exosortase A-associated)|nr:putative O-glycosylation ligase, exosortase A system-associated [Stellaceae bacterium]
MLHQILFLPLYLGMVPAVLMSPFAGVLLYYWLDNLPPDQVYAVTLIPDYASFAIGALTFLTWLILEKKTVPRPLPVLLLMIALLLWINLTTLYALASGVGLYEWQRTVKVIGFAILTAQMLSTRARLEAFVWVLVLSAIYFAVPGAIKVIISGGSGGIGTGEVVVGAEGSFFGDRVTLSVVLALALPFALYLGRRTTLLPIRWQRLAWPAMLGVAATFLIALIGTFARTGLVAGSATLLMLAARSQRKIVAALVVAAVVLALLAITPDNWFFRMDTIVNYQDDGSAMSRIAAWKWAWHLALEHPIVGGGFGVFTLDAGSIPGRPGWLEAHNIFFEVMGEHGFVGLGLFCSLIAAIYRSCTLVQKRVRGYEALAWTADLARATQVGLVAFVVGGSFVSIAFSPFLYLLAGIAVGTRGLVERELAALAPGLALNRAPAAGRPLVQPAA